MTRGIGTPDSSPDRQCEHRQPMADEEGISWMYSSKPEGAIALDPSLCVVLPPWKNASSWRPLCQPRQLAGEWHRTGLVDLGVDCGDTLSQVALANEGATRTHAPKVKKERVWIAGAAREAFEVWSRTSGPLRTTTTTLPDSKCCTGTTIARGNLVSVHGLLRSLGAFVDPADECADNVSKVALAGDGAAVADSGNVSGASIVSTLEVDYKTLCLAAYRHARIKMALLDVSNTVSMNTLSQYFNSLCPETHVVKATTADQARANSNLCTSPHDTKMEARNDLVDVLSRPMADRLKGQINLGAIIPVRHTDVQGVCGRADDSVFTFTGLTRGNGRTIRNCTPLHCAVICGETDVLEALLKAYYIRVDTGAKTNEGMTALHYAVQQGDTRAIKALLRSGADARARTKRRETALHMAVQLDNLDNVRTLLGDGGLAIRAVDKGDPSPLKASCGESNAELLPSPRVRPAGILRKSNRTGQSKFEDLRSAEHEQWLEAAKMSPRCSTCVNSGNELGERPLHIAASVGNIKVVQALLARGARPQATDKRGDTPLHTAVAHAHHDTVLALLAAGACVGRANNEGRTPLHVACDFGGRLSLATIDALLAHGASTTCEECNGCTPLHVATLSLDNKVASAAAGAQGTLSRESGDDSRKESTSLHVSVDKSSEDVVEFLLAHGAPVSARNHQGKSPLGLACEKGHLGIVHILLCAGASPGVKGEEGISPLHTACARGNVEMVKLLLDAGACAGHCWNSRGVSPLHVAAEWGNLGAVKALLSRLKRRQIDMNNTLGATPLIAAVKRQDKDIVAALLKAGADPTAWTPEGRPLLSVAAGMASNSDSAEVVRSLLKGGAQPGAYCIDGLLPLHIACAAGGDAGVVQALLAGGAEINSPCPGDGFLHPLHLAARSGHAEAARVLATTAGCRLHGRANNRATALTMAVSNGHTETVRALLESGATLEQNVLDENGTDIGSHVHLAILNGHIDTCGLLLQAMTIEAQARARKLGTDNIGGVRFTDQSCSTTSGGVRC